MRPIAVYHEHPDWFRPLFVELEKRKLPYVKLDAAAHRYDPGERSAPYSLVVNRASPSAYLRGHAASTFHTLHWVRHLERIGVPVVNGSKTYGYELSKASQIDALAELGLPFPRSIAINDVSQAVAAATDLRYPVLLKANIGGSGAGITKFDTAAALERAVSDGSACLGIDGVSLVQEAAPLRGGHITRVETLGGKFLYAINIESDGGFDLCPADACIATPGRAAVRMTATTPPLEVIKAAESIAQAAHLDVGGIEYLIDDRDGEVLFYDINALSNFVARPLDVLGWDPHEALIDLIEARIAERKAS
jgi:hypothetical protein